MKAVLSMLLVVLYLIIAHASATPICRALALGGGGDRGAFEAGALKALVELQGADDVKYDVVTGISAGSINAVAFSQFPIGQERDGMEYLLQRWKAIKRTDVYKNWSPGGIAEGFLMKTGLFDTSPLYSYIQKNVDINKVRTSGRWLNIGTSNLNLGKFRIFNETSPDVLLGVMGSSAVPGVFPAVKIGSDYYVDGGVQYMSSISDAVKDCFDKYKSFDIEVRVDVILAISDVAYPGLLDKIMTTPLVLFHSIYTMLNNILIADIQNAEISFPQAKIRTFKPSTWLPGYFLGFGDSDKMIQQGYNDAKALLNQADYSWSQQKKK